MPLATALALLLSAASADAAIAEALALPGARAEVVEVRPALARGCAAEGWEALRPVGTSGRAALRVRGRDASGAACEGFAWARVRVLAPALVATRALRSGEPLAGAVAPAEAEVLPGRAILAVLPEGAMADRPIAAGAALEPSAIRAGPRPGEPVAVIVRAGALALEQTARAAACPRRAPDRGCAILPSGKRVEGVLAHGRIVVEVP